MNLPGKEFFSIDMQALLDGCRTLIQTPGTAGQEQEAANALRQMLQEAGFDRVWSDGVGNVIGEIKGELPGPKILFDAQLDAMPVSGSERWSFDPYEGEVSEGKVYGRGAVGMKGALAAMVQGLAPLARNKSALPGAVYVSGSIGGEVYPGLAFSQVLHVVKPDAVVIGAPTGLKLAHAQRGRAEISLTVFGKAAHSACAQAGNNAVLAMLRLIEEVNCQPVADDEKFGQAKLVLTNIISAPYPAAGSVPHKCWATFDRYLLPGEGEAQALKTLKASIDSLERTEAGFGAEVELVEDGLECYTGQYLGAKRIFPAWDGDSENDFYKLAQDSLTAAGVQVEPYVYPLPTNATAAALKTKLPTIGFGPGLVSDMHAVDEAVEIAQLEAAAAGYQAIALRFLRTGRN